jgi:hypothetical protein
VADDGAYERVTFLVNIWLDHRPVGTARFPEELAGKVGDQPVRARS